MEDVSNQIREKLFNIRIQDTYLSKEKYQDHLMEQYKIYLESADRISSYRQTANSFFVTINTALIAIVGYLNICSNSSKGLYSLVALAGMILSFMWYRLIRSYRDLNTAKYRVVHLIEEKLPISPYDAEWEVVARGKNSKLYLPFTHIEIGVPWIFLILHLIAFFIFFPWDFF